MKAAHTKLFFAGLPFFLMSGLANDITLDGVSVALAFIGVLFEIGALVKYIEVS
jgi:hypothetical protein